MMTNHTSNNTMLSKQSFTHQHTYKNKNNYNNRNYNHKNNHASNSNSNNNNNNKSKPPKPAKPPLNVITNTNTNPNHTLSLYPDIVTTNSSYYSPQSQLSGSFNCGSLSPLSINSNSFHSIIPQNKSSSTINCNIPLPSTYPLPSRSCSFHGYSNYRKYKFSDKQSAKFSLQVFVAMHTTRQLAWYTVHEPWGDKNSLLFKYLDYTFRCAAFRDQVYIFEEKLNNNIEYNEDPSYYNDDGINNVNKNESRLIFNTGLICRQSGETIYLMLTPNQKKSVAQQWRVGYGDPYNRYNSSFVTDQWLLKYVIPNNDTNLLPKQFILNNELFYKIKDKFHKNKLKIEADFDHIVTKYWDRIIGEYNKRSSLNVPSKEETTSLLKNAFESVLRNKKKHLLLTPMLYVDSHNTQHSVEYMVPLPIDIPYRHNNSRRNNGNYERIWFAAALVSRERNQAQLMSILSADMAYSNARLIGSVTTPWLKRLAPLYHKLETQLVSKISPILKVYHIQQDDDDVERFLYSRFSKYGKILSVDIDLINSPNQNDITPSDQFSASIKYTNTHSVIEAYNASMDCLNRGDKLIYELDFELLKELEEREGNNNNNNSNSNSLKYNDSNCTGCQFTMLFSQPHILPPPDQLLLLSSNNIGPFYPINRINHECLHCHNNNININDNISHDRHHSHHTQTSLKITNNHYKHNNNNNNRRYNNNNNTRMNSIKNNNNRNYLSHENNNIDDHYLNNHTDNYRALYKTDSDWKLINDSLRSYGINTSVIKYIRRCTQITNNKKLRYDENHKKSTTDTTLWYMTDTRSAHQVSSHGFIFKYMKDFSKLMDTSGFKFETTPRITSNNNTNSNEIHLFQCKLRLTDKQLGYLRHNGNIIITDTRIINPKFWIVFQNK